MVGSLSGKIALISGASSGIGAATAQALAAAGATVLVSARRADRLSELVGSISAAGGKAVAIEADFADEASVRKVFDGVAKDYGRLDILINNAGVMLLSPVNQARAEDLRRMVEINLVGLMNACLFALPLIERSDAGHFVNVASIAGRVANPGSAGYAATKFGVVGFSESLRREVYAKNIRVTVIEPGMVATELGDHITNEGMKSGLEQRLQTMVPLQASDIAAAILYAVSQPPHVNVNEIVIRPTSQER